MLFNKEAYKEALRTMFAENDGIHVLARAPGTPSDRAGVRPRDLITHVNGQKISSLSDYTNAGQAKELRVLRVEMDPTTFVYAPTEMNISLQYTQAEQDRIDYDKSVSEKYQDHNFADEIMAAAAKLKTKIDASKKSTAKKQGEG